jgi:hypothetical protein
MVLDLWKLKMDYGLILHLNHVAGKCMIAQGTDGLSKGASCQGVMTDTPFLDYVSLHRNALDRQGPLLMNWALSWFTGPD